MLSTRPRAAQLRELQVASRVSLWHRTVRRSYLDFVRNVRMARRACGWLTLSSKLSWDATFLSGPARQAMLLARFMGRLEPPPSSTAAHEATETVSLRAHVVPNFPPVSNSAFITRMVVRARKH